MATPVIFLSFTPRCGGCVTGRPLSICWLIIHNTFQFIPRIVEMERKTRAVYFRQWRTRRAYLRIKIQPASLFARVPRTLRDCRRFKATEWRSFVMYTGVKWWHALSNLNICSKPLLAVFLWTGSVASIFRKASNGLAQRISPLPPFPNAIWSENN